MAATDSDVIEEKTNWHWRNSMRPVRFFNFDARAAIPFVLLLFHARLSTLFITGATLIVFNFLEKRGLTFPAALRALRVWLIGSHRPGLASVRRRRMTDYG